MICPSCRTLNPDTARICTGCNSPISVPPPQKTVQKQKISPQTIPHQETFRSPFFKTYFWLLGATSLGVIVSLIFLQGPDLDRNIELVLFSFVLLIVLDLMTMLVFQIIFFVIRIDAKGVQGRDFWGKRVNLQWEEVSDAKTYNILGLRYLRLISPSRKKSVWVPPYLHDNLVFCVNLQRAAKNHVALAGVLKQISP